MTHSVARTKVNGPPYPSVGWLLEGQNDPLLMTSLPLWRVFFITAYFGHAWTSLTLFLSGPHLLLLELDLCTLTGALYHCVHYGVFHVLPHSLVCPR
jgi:hypothetical protein